MPSSSSGGPFPPSPSGSPSAASGKNFAPCPLADASPSPAALCSSARLAIQFCIAPSDHCEWVSHITGLGGALLGLAPWSNSLIRRLAALGAVAYGIYLVHHMIHLGIEMLVKRLHLEYNPLVIAASILTTIVLSTLVAPPPRPLSPHRLDHRQQPAPVRKPAA